MMNSIVFSREEGVNCGVVLIRFSDSKLWRTSTNTFETYDEEVPFTDYILVATEVVPGYFSVSRPSSLSPTDLTHMLIKVYQLEMSGQTITNYAEYGAFDLYQKQTSFYTKEEAAAIKVKEILQSDLDTLLATSSSLDSMIEVYDNNKRYKAVALATAPTDVNVIKVAGDNAVFQKLLMADVVISQVSGSFIMTYSDPATSDTLLQKRLLKIDGSELSSISDIIARKVTIQ